VKDDGVTPVSTGIGFHTWRDTDPGVAVGNTVEVAVIVTVYGVGTTAGAT
jgi:hypothetical protein